MRNARLTGALALSIAYGVQVDTPDNEILRSFNEVTEALKAVLVPGAFLVDVLPPRRSGLLSADHRQEC